jgi:hypothetical protein
MQSGTPQRTNPQSGAGSSPIFYQIDFTAVAAGKRIPTSKRRVRWYVIIVVAPCSLMLLLTIGLYCFTIILLQWMCLFVNFIISTNSLSNSALGSTLQHE